jgi:hypothetical protein
MPFGARPPFVPLYSYAGFTAIFDGVEMSAIRCTCIGFLEPHRDTGRPSWHMSLPDPECPFARHREVHEPTDTPAPA